MGKLGKSFKKAGKFIKKNAKPIAKIGVVAGLAVASVYTGGAASPALMASLKGGKAASLVGKGIKAIKSGKAITDKVGHNQISKVNGIFEKSRKIGKQTFQAVTKRSASQKPFEDFAVNRLNEVEEAKTNLMQIGEQQEEQAESVRKQSFWEWFMGKQA